MKKIVALAILLSVFASCATKKQVLYSKKAVQKSSNIAVIIDSQNNIKNVVLKQFMDKGFKVKAFNSSDLYSMKDVFDISDFKKVAYDINQVSYAKDSQAPENIYKLHIFNFEAQKAETLANIRDKWDVQYLVLLEIKDWGEVSWGRAIDLSTYEIVWLENYPTRHSDNIETVVDKFIAGLSEGR